MGEQLDEPDTARKVHIVEKETPGSADGRDMDVEKFRLPPLRRGRLPRGHRKCKMNKTLDARKSPIAERETPEVPTNRRRDGRISGRHGVQKGKIKESRDGKPGRDQPSLAATRVRKVEKEGRGPQTYSSRVPRSPRLCISLSSRKHASARVLSLSCNTPYSFIMVLLEARRMRR